MVRATGGSGQDAAAASLMAALRGSAAPSLMDSPIDSSAATPEILLVPTAANAAFANPPDEEQREGGETRLEEDAAHEVGSRVAEKVMQLASEAAGR